MDTAQHRSPLLVVGLSLVFTWMHIATGLLRTHAGLWWVALFYLCLTAFMVGLVFLDRRDAKTRAALAPTGLVAGACLMLAPLALAASSLIGAAPNAALLVFACVAGPYGVAHSYRSWSTPFSSMPARQSCAMVAQALVVSIVLELVCYTAGFTAACVIIALLGGAIPFLLNASYSHIDCEALQADLVEHDFMTNVKAALPLWRIAVGIGVFSFAMGVSWTLLLSNPQYDLMLTDYMTEGMVLVLTALLALVSVKVTQRVSFSVIWRCIVLLMSAAILVSPQVDGLAYEFAVSLVRAAQSMMAVLWFLVLTDVSRKMRIDASHVIGMGWVFYSLPIAAGVVFGILLAPINPLETLLPALTVLALVAVAFNVGDRDLEQDLFVGLEESEKLAAGQGTADVAAGVAAGQEAAGVAVGQAVAGVTAGQEAACMAASCEAAPACARTADSTGAEADAAPLPTEPAPDSEPPRKQRAYTADPERREAEVVLPEHKRRDDGMGSGRRDKLSVRCVAIARDYNLTNREFDVLVRLAHGRSGAYIAQELTLSENTVKGHAKRLYAKLGIHTRQELINMAENYELKG